MRRRHLADIISAFPATAATAAAAVMALYIAAPAARAEYPTDFAPSRTHPILHFTKPEQTLNGTYNASTFRQLNRLWMSKERQKYGREDMRLGEYLACGDLHRVLLSKTPAQVQNLIGSPAFVIGNTEKQSAKAENPVTYVYYLGFHPVLVRVNFVQNRCIQACTCDMEIARSTLAQFSSELAVFAKGKTVAQIEKHLRYQLSDADTSLRKTSLSFSRQDVGNSAETSHKVQELTLKYVAAPCHQVGFHFTDGICDQVFDYVIFGW